MPFNQNVKGVFINFVYIQSDTFILIIMHFFQKGSAKFGSWYIPTNPTNINVYVRTSSFWILCPKSQFFCRGKEKFRNDWTCLPRHLFYKNHGMGKTRLHECTSKCDREDKEVFKDPRGILVSSLSVTKIGLRCPTKLSVNETSRQLGCYSV